ncbi:putative N-acetylated-alpha-linked acidic dipeptidase isoform X2 [Stylophora pistillata]|uniref:N-acetylated-alpha-linked acidic dipeptidase 2 n=1 Tax=Stylophora pistillata TaxID=50429 RepID=A0A2B4RDH5_STYPI|nr:putative N-acetylated-alpha-linked acidic dipeptidase isoform X2 [Stylophora pistillata]PFX14387.1 N-acetylated-alpha-linked acidic dipeptidase 2 [Stylophora pistillata]
MELNSSKLHLSSSFSQSEISFGGLRPKKKQIVLIVLFIGVISASGGFLLGYFLKGDKTIKNEHCPKTKDQSESNPRDGNEAFSQFKQNVNTTELEETLRFYSKEPHLAGGDRQRQLAFKLAETWRGYVFDEVEIPDYKVLLSYPEENNPNTISVVSENGTLVKNFTEQLKVSPGPGIKATDWFTPYTAYSNNGTAEGRLVYVNRGTAKDLQELEKLNISLNGTILLTRDFWGFFTLTSLAISKGAKGILMYPDPNVYAPEGIGKNSTYPNAPWLSSEAVPLGGVYGELGDPLSKGLPSKEGIFQKSKKNWQVGLPLLLQPISYGTARSLLEEVGVDDIPSEWLKNLDLTLQLNLHGSSGRNRTVKLTINNQLVQKTIYNVIGTINGWQEPDRYVFLGNHRDAWVYGAADATTGIAVLKETSRVLGKLLKQGWRPRRTIKLCSFGGEEFGLIGSVEWMEENSLIFKERGVAYLNTDVPVQGNYVLLAQTSPLLSDVIYKWTKLVEVPFENGSYESIYDVMLKRGPTPSNPHEPKLWAFQFASDYIPFFFMAGIPSADFSYFFGYDEQKGGWKLYPSYHTQEDNFYWVKKFADPEFEIHRAMTLLMGGMLLDLSDSQIIPFNLSRLMNTIHRAFDSLTALNSTFKSEKAVRDGISAVSRSIANFSRSYNSFTDLVSKVSREKNVNPLKVRLLNNQLSQVGKSFIDSRHSTHNPSIFQNVLFKDSFLGVLGAFVEARTTNDTAKIQEQLSIVSIALSTAAKILEPIRLPKDK